MNEGLRGIYTRENLVGIHSPQRELVVVFITKNRVLIIGCGNHLLIFNGKVTACKFEHGSYHLVLYNRVSGQSTCISINFERPISLSTSRGLTWNRLMPMNPVHYEKKLNYVKYGHMTLRDSRDLN